MPSAPNYAVLPYLPLIVMLAAEPARRLRDTLPLLGLVVLQCLSSIYVAAATVSPLGVLAVGRLLRRETRAAGLRLLALLGVAVLVLLGAHAGYVLVRADNPALFSARPGAVWGSPKTPLPAGVFRPPHPTAVQPAAFAVILLGAAIFVLRRAWRERNGWSRAWLHAGLWATVGLFISLTPIVSWNGRPLALPQEALDRVVPIYRLIRAPARLGVAGLVGLSLLTGIGFASCASWLQGRAAGGRVLAALARAAMAAAVAWLLYATYARGVPVAGFFAGRSLPRAYPLAPAIGRHDPVLTLIDREGTGPVLEVPISGGPTLHAEAMYRSIHHGRPLLNGYSGYWPDDFPRRMALACRLPDPEALAALRRETGVRTIAVHLGRLGANHPFRGPYRCDPEVIGTAADLGGRWLDAARGRGDLRLTARTETLLVFDVATGP
jgi:hypothetical protein